MFLLKEVAALLIFVDLRSEGNRSLFKTENIITIIERLVTFTTVTDLQLLILLVALIIVSQKNSFAS